MHKVSDITAVSISLRIAEQTALFVLLAADGTVNRLGTGAVDNEENDLFIGVTQEPLFATLLSHFRDDLLEHLGGYDLPEKLGQPCTLSIGLKFANEDEDGFGFRYGSESQGPPRAIVEVVTTAVRLTDPWFEEQKLMVDRSKNPDSGS